MLPSKRIEELRNVSETVMDALIKYLDEEHEKNKLCEHKDAYQVDSLGDVYYNVCNDCGVLFLAPQKVA